MTTARPPAWPVRAAAVHGRRTVVPAVTGTAYATGTGAFTVDPDDTLVPGFVRRRR
ncbi:hypothetical protein [Streptomyces californicus]|uniref:hypothetical protein n=1 Tax=Streptomyces californicus TaxID=67351 RepID=UPI003787C2B1